MKIILLLFQNLVEALRAASDAACFAAETITTTDETPTFFEVPDLPTTRKIIENSKRDGFEVDRENLSNDWKRAEEKLREIYR